MNQNIQVGTHCILYFCIYTSMFSIGMTKKDDETVLYYFYTFIHSVTYVSFRV